MAPACGAGVLSRIARQQQLSRSVSAFWPVLRALVRESWLPCWIFQLRAFRPLHYPPALWPTAEHAILRFWLNLAPVLGSRIYSVAIFARVHSKSCILLSIRTVSHPVSLRAKRSAVRRPVHEPNGDKAATCDDGYGICATAHWSCSRRYGLLHSQSAPEPAM